MTDLLPAVLPASGFLVLAALALADSTSIGTLGVPALMLAQRRIRPAAVLVYLATIGLFYWAVGVLVLGGVTAGIEALVPQLSDRVIAVLAIVAGVALFAASYVVLPAGKDAQEEKRRRRAEKPGPAGRALRRVLGEGASVGAVVVLAVAAGVAELALMVPYLAAIGIMSTMSTSVAGSLALLALYVLVMVAPAVALLGGRVVFAGRVQPVLARVGDWVTRSGDTTAGWVMGILGVVLVVNGVGGLSA